MTRSIWKGPFVDGYMLKKAEKALASGRNDVIKIWSRRSTILPQFVGVTFGVQKIMRKASFRIENGKYILVYNQLRSHFSVESKKIPRTEYQLMNDLVTLKYTEDVTKKDRSTRFRGKELFDAGTNFTTNYWKTGNILVLTGEEEKIIRQLEAETLSP